MSSELQSYVPLAERATHVTDEALRLTSETVTESGVGTGVICRADSRCILARLLAQAMVKVTLASSHKRRVLAVCSQDTRTS